MNMSELTGKLGAGEKLIVNEEKSKVSICVKGVVKRTYIIVDDGDIYPETLGIPSVPPTGQLRVTNLFVDKVTGKLVVEYDDQS